MTPDGPRGPRYVVQPGVVYVAQKAGIPVVPIGFASERYWEFRSWDRFRVPKPFSKGHLVYGAPIPIPRKLDDDGLEACRLKVEEGLIDASQEARERVGLPREDLA